MKGNIKIYFSFYEYQLNIDAETLEYLLDIYPLGDNDASRMTIKNLVPKIISVKLLTKLIRDKNISLTLDLWKHLIGSVVIDYGCSQDEFINFIETCLEISKWQPGTILNTAFKTVLEVNCDLSDNIYPLWKNLVHCS